MKVEVWVSPLGVLYTNNAPQAASWNPPSSPHTQVGIMQKFFCHLAMFVTPRMRATPSLLQASARDKCNEYFFVFFVVFCLFFRTIIEGLRIVGGSFIEVPNTSLLFPPLPL